MSLTIVTGGVCSDKQDYLCRLIRESLASKPDSNAVLIVPEQYSYTTEKALSEKFGGLGPNRIEVLTFSRLIHRFIGGENNLLASGKMMLVAKAASRISNDNMFFASAKKQGFVSSLSELFSELKRYEISAEDLDEVVTENVLCQKKLDSVNEIYKNYLNFFSKDFTDSEDAPRLFAEFVNSTDTFKNTFFFIDEYNDFMPQHYEIIRALIRTSRGVTITLSLPSGTENAVFEPILKTKKRLSAIALSENRELKIKELEEKASLQPPELLHLLRNWDSTTSYSDSCQNISVFTARDLYSEISHIAAQIKSLVRDKKMRYRDIGVVLGDTSSYLHILSAVFNDNNIPFFTDEKICVTMHPIVRTLLSLFKILDSNWTYSSVFDYLRSGYIYTKTENGVSPLDQEEIDILENYVLANGIRGKKAWFSPWTEMGGSVFDDVIENYSRQDYDLDKLNILREQIILPFKNFLENHGRTTRAIATSVYEFLCGINLYEGILAECEKFDRLGLRNESEQFKQIWNTILEVLDQLVYTMGDDVISRENFARYMQCGLSQCSISIIPSGLDRVSVGSVERNSPSKVKVLFIAGALYGSIPKEPSASAILSAFDRSQIDASLSKKDKELAPDDLGRLALSNLKLYRVVSTAENSLFISYPVANPEGNALAPARFVTNLLKMFPQIIKEDNLIASTSEKELLSSSKQGFYYMLTKLSQFYRKTPDKTWQKVLEWYQNNPEYSSRLDILKSAAEYRRIIPRLSKLKAQALFGSGKRYSITALEKYSKCPFSYYLEKGLKAMPQEVKKVEKSHIGSLTHAAIYTFCKMVEKDAKTISEIHKNWLELTEVDTNQMIAQIMADIRKKIARDGVIPPQIEYLLFRCENTLKKTVATITKSLSSGGYTAVCYEKDFEINIDWKNESVTLFGTIDRIDLMEKIAENRADIRIIDYKTGHKKFSISAIVNRLDMQLVLYAIAAKALYEKGNLTNAQANLKPSVSAIWYNKINDDMVKLDSYDEDLAQKLIKNKNKLDGVVILDEDASVIDDMDKNIFNQNESEFLNISLKKDGLFTQASQVTDRKTFDNLCAYMKKSAIDIHKSITDGDIRVSPYKNGQFTPCTFCDYGQICMFDGLSGNFRQLISKEADALEYLEKEMSEDE